MSHPQSRSPMCSRIPALLGRRADVFFDDQIRLNAQSDSWRKAEAGSKGEGKPHWNKDHHHGEQSVDHWANFIDAIKHAQERSGVSVPEYSKQVEERRPTHCPRRLPREMLSSPEQERFGAEERFKNLSSRVDRNEDVGKSEGRQDPVFHLKHREIKDESHPRHSDGRRHDRMEYGYLNKDHQEQYHDRGGFSERSSKSDNRERHRSAGFTHFGERDAFSEHHGGFSPRQTPVIVEHGHGFGRQDFRDGQRMGYWKSKGSQPQGRGGIPSNHDPHRAQREQDFHSNALQGRSSGHPSSYVQEEPRRYHPYQKVSREKDRPRPFEHSRMDSNRRDSEEQRQMDARGAYDIDLRSQGNHFGNEWEDEGGQRNHGRMMEQELRQRPQFHRKSNNHVAPTPRQDFSGHETLRIKVDMSRPVGQSSHLGYSSDRQLSLDLVNVGRQRLDFLPMLEHSGVYKESAIHSGTFAQEIINLVHQVKENYFPGQGITLNERFMREQYDSLQGASRDEDDDGALESVRPVINRLGMPKPHVFCKVEPEHPEAHQFTPDPGDLRYDLERRRQQRQENVKITIAGGNFAQVMHQCQESEARYLDKEPEAGEFRWSEQAEPQRQWNGSHQRNHGSHRQNFAPRGNFNSNTRPFGRRF